MEQHLLLDRAVMGRSGTEECMTLKVLTEEGKLRILIAIDHSEASDIVVREVIGQVKPAGTEVRLLHVVDSFPETQPKKKGPQNFPDFVAERKHQRAFAEKLLTLAAERLRAAAFSVSSSIREGEVRALILEEAQAWRADLIVLGAHPRKGVKRFFTSSISEDVSREAPCSVEIIRVPKNTECVPSVEPSEMCLSEGAGRTGDASSSDAAVSCFLSDCGGGLC